MGYKNIVEQKHPDKLEKFRELVLSKIVRFASDNKDITIGIITAINEITELYPLRGWVRGPEIKTESDPFADYDDEVFSNDVFKGADEIFYDDEVKDSPNKGTDKHEIKTLYYINDDCITCGTCIDECPVNAIIEGDSTYEIDQNLSLIHI